MYGVEVDVVDGIYERLVFLCRVLFFPMTLEGEVLPGEERVSLKLVERYEANLRRLALFNISERS